MSNYTTKSDSKNKTGIYTLDLAKKIDLACLKSDVDKLDINELKISLSSFLKKAEKLDIGKLETTPIDLSKLSNVVKNNVVKKTEYDELVKKVNNIS